MWWNSVVFGWETYHVVMWFLTYSFIGWIVESCYMSLCNKKITNRGFARGPMCPIYGVGALSVYFILKPVSSSPLLLFMLGSLLATTLELFTAVVMQRIFGEIWWDYNDKPFNFHGILCLESSIAWGFYTLFLFKFLQRFVEFLVNYIPFTIGKFIGTAAITIYIADFVYMMYVQRTQDAQETQMDENRVAEEKIVN